MQLLDALSTRLQFLLCAPRFAVFVQDVVIFRSEAIAQRGARASSGVCHPDRSASQGHNSNGNYDPQRETHVTSMPDRHVQVMCHVAHVAVTNRLLIQFK